MKAKILQMLQLGLRTICENLRRDIPNLLSFGFANIITLAGREQKVWF